MRASAAAALLLAAAFAATALTACATASTTPAGPRFVTPPLIRYSSVLWPVPLELVGAEPGSRLRITATLTTSRGSWRSGATYTVPASGAIDLARARPQLAAFTDPDSAGLFWSLRGPTLDDDELARQWMDETSPVTLTASDGDRVVAARTFRLQGLAANLRSHVITTRDLVEPGGSRLPRQTHEDEPVGRFWDAGSLERPTTPAVLLFEDPTTGASSAFTAPLLSQFGASVFVLPVTSPDGVHATSVIDSTTVSAVLDWLDARTDVDHRHVFVYGTGPAEPLALWAATRFSDRLHGLFAGAGPAALLCLPGSAASPVLEDGVAVPCAASPSAALGAAAAVAAVSGPVVLACGTRDAVLRSSCDAQRAVAATRRARSGDSLLAESGAAHTVTVPPGLPIALPDASDSAGADAQATQRARVAFWNAVGQQLLRAVLS